VRGERLTAEPVGAQPSSPLPGLGITTKEPVMHLSDEQRQLGQIARDVGMGLAYS
jgi:hypothetical protein